MRDVTRPRVTRGVARPRLMRDVARPRVTRDDARSRVARGVSRPRVVRDEVTKTPQSESARNNLPKLRNVDEDAIAFVFGKAER